MGTVLANFEHTPRNSNDISQSLAPSSPLTFLREKLSFFAQFLSNVLDNSAVIIGKSKGQSISALCKWPHYIIWSISESKWHSIRGKKEANGSFSMTAWTTDHLSWTNHSGSLLRSLGSEQSQWPFHLLTTHITKWSCMKAWGLLFIVVNRGHFRLSLFQTVILLGIIYLWFELLVSVAQSVWSVKLQFYHRDVSFKLSVCARTYCTVLTDPTTTSHTSFE